MARASVSFENACLNGGAAVALFESLHSADPGTTGASEITGAGYARQSITWGAASGGSMANTNTLSTTVPASTTIAYFGSWSALTVGTYEVGGALSASITFNTSGTFTIAAAGLSVAAS